MHFIAYVFAFLIVEQYITTEYSCNIACITLSAVCTILVKVDAFGHTLPHSLLSYLPELSRKTIETWCSGGTLNLVLDLLSFLCVLFDCQPH